MVPNRTQIVSGFRMVKTRWPTIQNPIRFSNGNKNLTKLDRFNINFFYCQFYSKTVQLSRKILTIRKPDRYSNVSWKPDMILSGNRMYPVLECPVFRCSLYIHFKDLVYLFQKFVVIFQLFGLKFDLLSNMNSLIDEVNNSGKIRFLENIL